MTSIADSRVPTSKSTASVEWQAPTQGSNPSQVDTNANVDDSKGSIKPETNPLGEDFEIQEGDFEYAAQSQEVRDIIESLYGGLKGIQEAKDKTTNKITHSLLESVFDARHQSLSPEFFDKWLNDITLAGDDFQAHSNLKRSAIMTLMQRQKKVNENVSQQKQKDQAAASGEA